MSYLQKISCFTFFSAIIIIPQTLKFERFSVEQGLSQSTVHTIMQDDIGFIWVGTQNGLNRFDGFQFTVYTNEKDDSTSISDNYIRSIVQDKYGFIWIGTNDGLNLLTLIRDNQTGKSKEGFYHFKNDLGNPNSLSDNEVRSLYADGSGMLWVGTAKGLNMVVIDSAEIKNGNLSAIKFTRYLNDPNNSGSISNNFISSIIEEGNGDLWVGTMGGGLNLFDRNTNKFIHFKNDPHNPNSISSNYVVRLFSSQSGQLWIGTYGGGFCRYYNESNKFISYKHDPADKNSIDNNRIYGIKEDSEGNLWIGTFGNGLYKFNQTTGEFSNFKNIEYDPNSLSNNFARILFIDRANNLWVGTNSGLNKADLKPPKFLLFKNDPWKATTLSDNFILSFSEDEEGFLWIGTNKGLDRYDRQSEEYINYKILHNNPMNSEGFIYSIQYNKPGILWLGTFGGGIYKFDPETGKIIKQYLNDPKKLKGLIDNRVTTLYQDSNGDLLIGTVAGICRLIKRNGEFKYFIVSSKDSSLLAEKWINRIYKDSKSNYWIGTAEGLFKIDSSSGECYEFLHDPDDDASISNNSVSSIYEDHSGNIWIGTDNGLNSFDKISNRVIKYFKKNGLAGNTINGILGDDDGNLWISITGGISKFNPETNIFRNYDLDDGLQGLEFNAGAYFKNKKGEILFGGQNGFNKFNPSLLEENLLPPAVAITVFKKFDKLEKGYLELTDLNTIELSYDDRFFSFEFASLDFTNPAKNQYAYQLEGFDKEWNFSGSRRFASYTNIDPGEYVFKVKGSNNDGVWSKIASLRIIISPPYYSTWWAYIIYSIVFVASLYYIRKYEINKRKRKEEERLREEREMAKLREAQLRADKAELQTKAIESEKEIEKQNIRYRIASDLHDEIGSNLSSITLLSSILTKSFLDNRKNPDMNGEAIVKLSDINVAAKSSAESIRDIVWFINPTSDKFSNLISRMKETANMMLGNINYEVVTNLGSSDEKINPDIKRNIYFIYKESLNNIIKHSKADKVNISVKKEGKEFNLSIEDNGTGFDETKVKAGNGLRNLKTRAEQISGDIKINSELERGTVIILKVPM